MRRLQVYTSLWAMQPHDPTGINLPYDQVCEMVAKAGFDGMAIDLGASDVAVAHAVRPHMEANNLTPLIVAFPKTIESLEDTLHMAADFGAPFVDVIGQVMPIVLDEMVPVIEAWIAMADRIGVPVQFETHRNCITNDLYTTLQLLDRIPDMRICADLSHYVVDREFWYPLSDHDKGLISRVLQRSDSFQGRVASRQQIQLQLDFPQNQKWVALFRDWWREGLADWRARNRTGDCIFACELGPPEYAMTGPDGVEMSNRWEEAQIIMRWVRDIWDDLGGDDPETDTTPF
ncbi:sugar phosphate isomerase/epimerase family protein [Yoonia sediminilitoris]|uniref:Xylose isomerase-like TIM barrel protein n=1 Tax=Yoonia sediminilitoris TaxID=1286148 RepID=A0A2T6KIL4_9RHOB|nr:TIM barrel protein [Yoonia sediminilitoris]PUB15557.1 xylose isomerase-like TIM barrel protein [Yoonia sediminilitoris]RCW96166.1 xylose isomerase-like TIM barrel protein [Yoonia sediminilitoris]